MTTLAVSAVGVFDDSDGDAVTVWRTLEAVAGRLIGGGGVRAIFERTVHVAASRHPWLLAEHAIAARDLSVERCVAELVVGRTAAEARAASIDLFCAFASLLARLIGEPLVMRLLAEAWPTWFPHPPTAKESR